MVDVPALELDLLAVLKANFTINHVLLRMIACLRIAYAAFRAGIVPKLNIRLLGDGSHFKISRLCPRKPPHSNHDPYRACAESTKQNLHCDRCAP